ncbi:unnamed protein product [marine sediment metagenome]|uniref:Uncharacterized protein n=1 Tax=marine sediment metagenome TaxID=412755 RepID=X0ZGK7_9ZZZZ
MAKKKKKKKSAEPEIDIKQKFENVEVLVNTERPKFTSEKTDILWKEYSLYPMKGEFE